MTHSTMLWWLIGRYGTIAVIAGYFWLRGKPWFPHRHDGYVSINGYVHACSDCGKLPPGTAHKGFGGEIKGDQS